MQKQEDAFNKLKKRFMTEPILKMFDYEKPAIVECDASDFAVGGVLSQKDEDGKTRPVAYISRKLSDVEQRYDIHDKELLAVVRSTAVGEVGTIRATGYPGAQE